MLTLPTTGVPRPRELQPWVFLLCLGVPQMVSMGPWVDGDLVDAPFEYPSIGLECLCFKCQRGGECRSMARSRAQWAAEDRRAEQLACLSDEDREWLTAHGWDGR